MKKFLYLLVVLSFTLLQSCNNKKSFSEITKDAIETVNLMSQREFSFDSSIPFKYTGEDEKIKAITDDLNEYSVSLFGKQGAVEIPTPYISKVDDSDKNDIKVYGNFYIYGYEMYGTIFHNKNGSANPGCYHLKEDNGEYAVIKKEFAEDGSRNWSSLVEICGGDEDLAKSVYPDDDTIEKLRMEFAKMYAENNNLRLSGIKDYGWPVILYSDISDAVFLYNFYRSYFDEVRQEDNLRDLAKRLENLKNKYMANSVIEKVDEMTMDVGADMVINAQDVTDQMVDTLEVFDFGGGELKVAYDAGSEEKTIINIQILMENGKKVITDLSY